MDISAHTGFVLHHISTGVTNRLDFRRTSCMESQDARSRAEKLFENILSAPFLIPESVVILSHRKTA